MQELQSAGDEDEEFPETVGLSPQYEWHSPSLFFCLR